MKKKNLRMEWISVRIAKNPAGVVLIGILLLNLIFFAVAAVIISHVAPDELQYDGFWASLYYTIMMVLDAGAISEVISDVGVAGVRAVVACMVVAIVGMITFTGAVIGYVTNYISGFIDNANNGVNQLRISNHTVILNWNSRASEIVNDMLYSDKPEKVVVLVSENRKNVEKEISDRLSDTLEKERLELLKKCAKMKSVQAWMYYRKHIMRNRVTVIVREGDTFSTQKLNDISIKYAKSVVILSRDIKSSGCKYDVQEQMEKFGRGDSNIVKTLIQVAEMTGAMDSANDQKVVVEVNDAWTLRLINRIIAHKEQLGKCNIVPVSVDQILGQILSQFSIMPELNTVYGELFSNKGAAFYSERCDANLDIDSYIPHYLTLHCNAVPLTMMSGKTSGQVYYVADHERDINHYDLYGEETFQVKLNPDFWLRKRKVVILGHNSKCDAIMNGFNSFRSEWNFKTPEQIEANGGREILDITVIDDEKSLERHRYYQQYPYVSRVVAADVFDRDAIYSVINEIIDSHDGENSILILSDDLASNEEMDANALAYLIYVQDIISQRCEADPSFEPETVDVVVEILNPKNYDIVRSYSIDNIVISNRYISKMVNQIGEKEDIFRLYDDILSYDEEGEGYESKELYPKQVSDFFAELPPPCTAAQLIRAVYAASPPENRNVVLGYMDACGKLVFFSGDQREMKLQLQPKDKLIVFSSH